MTLAGLQLSIHVNTINEANGTLEIWLWVTYFHPFVSFPKQLWRQESANKHLNRQSSLLGGLALVSDWVLNADLTPENSQCWFLDDSCIDCKRSLTARKINSRSQGENVVKWCPIYVQFTPPSTSLNSFSTLSSSFIQRSLALKTSLAVPLTVISEHLNAPELREDGHNQPGDDQNMSKNQPPKLDGSLNGLWWFHSFIMFHSYFTKFSTMKYPYWWSSYLVGVTKKTQAIWAQQHLKVSRFSFWSKAPPLPKTMLSAASAGMLQNLLRWNGEMSNFHGCNTIIS